MSNEKLDHLLAKWDRAKKDLAEQETKVDKYKKRVEALMTNTNVLKSDNYEVTKRSITKETISKESMPSEVWKQYARKATYEAYYLKRI